MWVRWRQLAFLHFCPRALSAFSLLFDWLLSSSINLLVTFFTRCSFWPLATRHPGQWPPGHPGQWYSLGKPSIPTCVNPNYQIVSPEAVPVPIPAGGKKCGKKTGVASCHWQHTYYVKHTKGSPTGPNHTGFTHTRIENHPLLPKSGSLMDKTISHNRDSKTHQHLLFAWEYLKKLTRRRTKSWMVTFQWLRCLDWDSVHIGTIF